MDPAVLAFTAAPDSSRRSLPGIGPVAPAAAPARVARSARRRTQRYGVGRKTAPAQRVRHRRSCACLPAAHRHRPLSRQSSRNFSRSIPGSTRMASSHATVFYSGDSFKKDEPRQATFVNTVIDNLSSAARQSARRPRSIRCPSTQRMADRAPSRSSAAHSPRTTPARTAISPLHHPTT